MGKERGVVWEEVNQELCVRHLAASTSNSMWFCFCYEPSTTCGGLIVLCLTFLASSCLTTIEFLRFPIFVIFLARTVHLFLTILVAQRQEIPGLAANLT